MNITQLRDQFRQGTLDKQSYIRAMLSCHNDLAEYVKHIGETDIEGIEILDTGLVFRLRNIPISLTCPANESRVAPIEILNFGTYEHSETTALERIVSGAKTIVDVGANLGWYSLWFASQRDDVRVHAFEPIPANFKYLSKNIALNKMGARVTAYNYGLSDVGGSFEFFTYETGITNASLRNVSGAQNARRTVGLTTTMDDWAEGFGVSPDLIKCDVEGAELLVFQGGSKTIRKHRPIVFTELLRKWSAPFGYHPNDVISFFNASGYECFAINDGSIQPFALMTEDTTETSFVFLHGDEHGELIGELRD